MRTFGSAVSLCCLALCAMSTAVGTIGAAGAQANPASARAEIEAFNKSFDGATRSMDNAATLALWEDDGVSLLPSTPPIVGKKAITAFMDAVIGEIKGAHMESFELSCFGIEVSGPWASEWCQEHQVVWLPEGKPKFEGWGKMLLVLHRGADGKWRLLREMWNQALAPTAPSHS